MNLREMLSARRDEIVTAWTERVRGTLHPESMPHVELVDELPPFIDEVAEALRRSESPSRIEIAASHGIQRLRLGFHLDSVVREYAVLRDCIVATAEMHGVPIQRHEHELLVQCTVVGISDAVTEYQMQRDAELHRHMNEHIAFLAHELRNPLGTALGAVRLLRARGQITEDRLGGIAERSLEGMRELIDHSLRVAKLGAGVVPEFAKVRLDALLDEVKVDAMGEAETKAINLVFPVGSDIEIEIDSRLVRSALNNLVRNAVKFTHHGGRVELRVRTDDGHRTIFEVEDECGGLPAEAVEQAFVPFVQLGTNRTGFGLGLAIARQAAEAHGGSVRVQNLPGTGCIFVLELPSDPRTPAATRAA